MRPAEIHREIGSCQPVLRRHVVELTETPTTGGEAEMERILPVMFARVCRLPGGQRKTITSKGK